MTDQPAIEPRDAAAGTPRERARPLVRVRQVREFEPESPTDQQLEAITDSARWSGSASNGQPWRFIVIRDRATLGALHVAGLPQTRPLGTAPAGIAVVLPVDDRMISRAYDEGRAAERIMIAANLVGLAAGITWIRGNVSPTVTKLLGLPADWFVRTIVAIGHPTEAARRPKSAPGQARLPREETVFEDRWPDH